MKRPLSLLCLLSLTALPALHADDVALLQIDLPKEKYLKTVAIEFYEADAPMTVENFKKLAKEKFYNGLAFHRAFPNLLVQVGDPFTRGRDRSRVGTGGPGHTVPAEIRRHHSVGAVSMARLPDKINPSRVSNGSQFFVCLAPLPNYDGQYTVFGHVFQGLDVLQEVSNQPVDSNDYPIDKIRIKSLKIVPREKVPGAPEPAPAPAAAGNGKAPAKPPAPAPAPAKKPWWKIF